MNVNLFKAFHENFGVRVFAAVAILISLISFCFTTFFIYNESKSLRDTAIDRGKLLAGILAHSARIGVFSENEKLLQVPVEGVLQQEGVLEVAIFNLKGQVLKKAEKANTGSPDKSARGDEEARNKMFEKAGVPGLPYYIEENNNRFQFWSPVVSAMGYSREESLFLGEEPLKRKENVKGSVRITVDKGILNKKLHALLLRGILMGIVFLLVGSAVTYLVLRGITRPLSKLTLGVKALERGGVAEKVSVETDDEIGKLARAFNDMSESLKRREDALRESEQRLRSLSVQLMRAQEKERLRVSKELHDELGQALVLLKQRIRSFQRRLQEGQSSLRDECEETAQYIDEILENVRRLSRDLSPFILEDLGLSSALRWLIENFAQQYSSGASFDIDNVDHLFSKDAQRNLYRISQEALTNIGKHAEANHVSFVVKENEDSVSFIIEDDGKGFDVPKVKAGSSPQKGLGLDTMEERAHMLRASLDISSKMGEGTKITLEIPTERGMVK
jgi:signal transduction histidine kinase